MTPFNPDGWMDFFLLVVIALIGMAGTTLPVLISRRQNKALDTHGKTLDTIQDQVVNNHPDTNLRDDIDKIAEKIDTRVHHLAKVVEAGFHETRKDIAGIREEMRTERLERIEGDRRGMRRAGLIPDEGDKP